MEETNDTKELVRQMNVDAVAKVLLDMKNYTFTVRSEQADITHMVSKITQDIAGLQAELNVLKAMGARGTIGGTGSTVHYKGE